MVTAETTGPATGDPATGDPATGDPATGDEIALLRGMLEIPSPSGGERPLAEYLCAEMAARGLHAHIDAAGNAVGTIGEQGPLVVLLGHMDTAPGCVPMRQHGDLLYGRGAVDAKGPLAAFICAAGRLRQRAERVQGLGLRLVVVGAVEEESATSRGARHVAGAYQPDACVIGEPSRWDRVTLGYKGRLLVDYLVRQPSEHSAGKDPTASERAVAFWNGVVALAAQGEWSSGTDAGSRHAADVPGRVREFERLRATLRSMHGESDGLCDTARLALSLRLPPGCASSELRARLHTIAGDATLRFAGDEPAYRAPKNTPLVRAFLGAIRSHGGTPAFALKTGTSDMNVVGPVWTCPILAYGPGDSSLDHTPDEHVSLTEYGAAIAVLEAALSQLTPTQARLLAQYGAR